ncbi:MAG: hypothetical protein ACJ710_12630 [Ornithinibacter sp.]
MTDTPFLEPPPAHQVDEVGEVLGVDVPGLPPPHCAGVVVLLAEPADDRAPRRGAGHVFEWRRTMER